MTFSNTVCTFANGSITPPVTLDTSIQTICFLDSVWIAGVPATADQLTSLQKPDPKQTQTLFSCADNINPSGIVYVIPKMASVTCVNSTVYFPYSDYSESLYAKSKKSSANRVVPALTHMIVLFLFLSITLGYSY